MSAARRPRTVATDEIIRTILTAPSDELTTKLSERVGLSYCRTWSIRRLRERCAIKAASELGLLPQRRVSA